MSFIYRADIEVQAGKNRSRASEVFVIFFKFFTQFMCSFYCKHQALRHDLRLSRDVKHLKLQFLCPKMPGRNQICKPQSL